MEMIVSAAILLIHDLDLPAAGFVAVSRRLMIDAAAGILTYSLGLTP